MIWLDLYHYVIFIVSSKTPYRSLPPRNLPTQYNAKAEVFTLAILLWEMTTGEQPYENMTPESVRTTGPKKIFCIKFYSTTLLPDRMCCEHFVTTSTAITVTYCTSTRATMPPPTRDLFRLPTVFRESGHRGPPPQIESPTMQRVATTHQSTRRELVERHYIPGQRGTSVATVRSHAHSAF